MLCEYLNNTTLDFLFLVHIHLIVIQPSYYTLNIVYVHQYSIKIAD